MIYSFSRLETYRQCPQRFKFQYIDKVSTTTEGVESFMGSRVHETLEKLYSDLRFCKPVTIEDLLAYYHQKWDTEWHDGVLVVREDVGPDEYRALGERCIVEYDRRYQPFEESRTVGVEYAVTFALDDAGQYMMQGYIDRLSQPEDGVFWIHDYKTRGFFPTQQDLDDDRQLAYYQMAVEKLWPQTRSVELVWHYLIYDHEFRSHRTADDLEALRLSTIALIQEIESATDFPTHQSGLCNWCPYQSVCPLFRHSYDTAALPKNDAENEEGVVLVERLATLIEAKEQNKNETEKVKEALSAYARKRGVETVFSRHHKVMLKHYDHWQFPGRDAPGRAALEKAVKAGEKWEEVSSLDLFVLDKKLQNQAWDASLRESITRFGAYEKVPWVKLLPKNGGRWGDRRKDR
jgi:putative RecB family exonuclease